MLYLADTDLSPYRNATCLLRVDLNTDEAVGEDNFKLRAIVPTVKFLRASGVRVILFSHRGRFGKQPPSISGFSVPLSKRLGEPVSFSALDDFSHSTVEGVHLMENLRFYAEEEDNDPEFGRKLADFGDFYVNEAFAVSHRQNASLTQICPILPSFGGLRLQEELCQLDRVLDNPMRPLVLVLGGEKIGDKLESVRSLLSVADTVLLGSSASSVSVDCDQCILPEDYVMDEKNIKLDVGEKTRVRYKDILTNARTIVWNGPIGYFQNPHFSFGTRTIWEAVLQNTSAHIVVGGGETIESLHLVQSDYNVPEHVFLSTGGGAMLAYLSGKDMPGLIALN